MDIDDIEWALGEEDNVTHALETDFDRWWNYIEILAECYRFTKDQIFYDMSLPDVFNYINTRLDRQDKESKPSVDKSIPTQDELQGS